MNKLKSVIYLMVLMLTFASCNPKQVVILVSDYGLKPNSKENAIPAIIKAIDE